MHLSLTMRQGQRFENSQRPEGSKEDGDIRERCQKDDDDEEGRVKSREGREPKG